MGSEEVYVITLVYRTIPIKNSVYSLKVTVVKLAVDRFPEVET
jgi:hypothetical protein